MLRVRLLGGLALEPGDVPSSRPARELLAWLALHPGRHPRLELAQRFWPDVPEASARANLRTTLHELRRALGDAAVHLDVDREHVGLRDVWVDLHELGPAELLEAGEPLTGIDRDWAIAARDEHRERARDAAGSPRRRGRRARRRAPLGARARPPRPALRGRRPPPDAHACRRRRPRRRDGRVRAPGDPPRTRALGRPVARDPPPAGGDPQGRPAAARHRRRGAPARHGPARARGAARGRRAAPGRRAPGRHRARGAAAARPRIFRPRSRRAAGRSPGATTSCGASSTPPAGRCCSPGSRGSGRRGCSRRRRGLPINAGRSCATGAATRSRSRRTSRSPRRSGRRRSPRSWTRPAASGGGCSRPSRSNSKRACSPSTICTGRTPGRCGCSRTCCGTPRRRSCSGPTATARSIARIRWRRRWPTCGATSWWSASR